MNAPTTDMAERIGQIELIARVAGRLVGREAEVSTVVDLLQQHRLVTLTGTGGIGKTRLALEVALEAARSFRGGVRLADLVPVTDPALVGQAVLDAFGVRDQSGDGVVSVLGDHLQDEPAMLVLDNCEHVLDTAATLVSELLAQIPGLTVLATSREWLNLPGEQLVRLTGLADAGVDLFAACADAATGGFTLDDRNRDVVSAIVDHLDGLPLAIELAAARLRVLSIPELQTRLADRYRVLRGTRRLVQSHHQTMHTCVEWSYDQCSPAEQTLWRRASVFAGSFDLTAAEAVCAFDGIEPDDVLDLITALIVEAETVLVKALRVMADRQEVVNSEATLEALAVVMHGTGRLELAMMCLGAGRRLQADHVLPEQVLTTFPVQGRALLEDVRRSVGGDDDAPGKRSSEALGLTEILDLVEGRTLPRPDDDRSSDELLTPSELEVAALVAEGLSKRAIAERLFITPRTVRGHLENTLTKLGARSRVEVVTWWADRRRT